MLEQNNIPSSVDWQDYIASLTLKQWFELIHNNNAQEFTLDCFFPTEKIKEEFITKINKWSEEEIFFILKKFLNFSGTYGVDNRNFESLLYFKENDSNKYRNLMKFQYFQRLVDFSFDKETYPWEGITWILDLLPHFPKQALEALDAYILAHIQLFSDDRLNGHWDAYEIILSRYIGFPGSNLEKINFLQNITSREFEIIIEKLYSEMGYETKLTKCTRDGGSDIIAKKNKPGNQEYLRIECKKYTAPIGINIIRELLGVVTSEKVNKGVIVTTSHFTKPTISFVKGNPRIELISGSQLVLLLNEFLGPTWPNSIQRIIQEKLSTELNNL